MPNVDFLVLAEAVSAGNGKLHVLGAGWSKIHVSEFPFTYPALVIALRASFGWNETDKSVIVTMDVVNADGHSILGPMQHMMGVEMVPSRSGVPDGEDQAMPFALTAHNLVFTCAGTYAAVVKLNGVENARSTFRVTAA